MQLTSFTDYALRVLMQLGMQPEVRTTVPAIAAAWGISEHHLVKVVHFLGQSGWVETSRGRGGGLQLAVQPAKIRIGQVVRKTEDNLALVECMAPDRGHCRITSACKLREVLYGAQQAFFAELDRYTLADLLGPAPRWPALLGSTPSPVQGAQP